MTLTNSLQQELIKLLVQLKEQASSADRMVLQKNINAWQEVEVKENEEDIIKICFYLALLTTKHDNLMQEFNKAFYEAFQTKIVQVNNLNQSKHGGK